LNNAFLLLSKKYCVESFELRPFSCIFSNYELVCYFFLILSLAYQSSIMSMHRYVTLFLHFATLKHINTCMLLWHTSWMFNLALFNNAKCVVLTIYNVYSYSSLYSSVCVFDVKHKNMYICIWCMKNSYKGVRQLRVHHKIRGQNWPSFTWLSR
jgi:hypothetical protein